MHATSQNVTQHNCTTRSSVRLLPHNADVDRGGGMHADSPARVTPVPNIGRTHKRAAKHTCRNPPSVSSPCSPCTQFCRHGDPRALRPFPRYLPCARPGLPGGSHGKAQRCDRPWGQNPEPWPAAGEKGVRAWAVCCGRLRALRARFLPTSSKLRHGLAPSREGCRNKHRTWGVTLASKHRAATT